MKRNYTLNLCYVLCVVVVLLAYPVKNYSAIVAGQSKGVEKVEKAVTQPATETLRSDLLFKW